ncbi:MAG: sigma-70 family RNA polymerase sigma factor [Saprospiraceae bacterium]|nr:sigma-70 family RNA polymerase sigma factor [Saprospiraceae bacterium]
MSEQQITNSVFKAAFCPLNEINLARLYKLVRPPVFAYQKSLKVPRHLWKDFLSVGITAVWQKTRITGCSEHDNYYGMLIEIIKHQWYNELRRLKYWGNTVTPEDLRLFIPDPSILELLEIVEFKQRLYKYLDKLGDPCRQLLSLWSDGYSYGEIVEIMAIKDANTARQQRLRCMNTLLKMMEGDNEIM